MDFPEMSELNILPPCLFPVSETSRNSFLCFFKPGSLYPGVRTACIWRLNLFAAASYAMKICKQKNAWKSIEVLHEIRSPYLAKSGYAVVPVCCGGPTCWRCSHATLGNDACHLLFRMLSGDQDACWYALDQELWLFCKAWGGMTRQPASDADR